MSNGYVEPGEQVGGCPWHRNEHQQQATVLLAPSETVPGRSFTDPQQSIRDLAALEAMRNTLRHMLQASERLPRCTPPLLLHPSATEQHRQRVILLDPDHLLSDAPLTAVGFFGQIRSTADHALLDALDLELIAEFVRYPTLLSYSSLEIAPGVWGNLVLLQTSDAATQWSQGAKHAYVAHTIAPASYDSIRLHNAVLPNGVCGNAALRLVRTKYYDFQHTPAWRAVRDVKCTI